MIPPALLMLRIRSLYLPLPLFLLWPLMLLLGLLAGGIWLIMGRPMRGRCRSILVGLRAFGALRGLDVTAGADRDGIRLKFI
jgi:hypothetical protein